MEHQELVLDTIEDALNGDIRHLRVDAELLIERLKNEHPEEAQRLQRILDTSLLGWKGKQQSLWSE